jgi:hypothetical protein
VEDSIVDHIPLVQEVETATIQPTKPLLVAEAVLDVLFAPKSIPENVPIPNVTVAFLLSLLTLLLLGVSNAPGSGWKPLMVCLLALISWGLLVTTLMITGSLSGATLKWSQAARLISLAGVPFLAKLAAGCILAIVSSVSPFLFSASPAIFVKNPPLWVYRLDLFDLWSMLIIYALLSNQRISKKQARYVTLTVWVLGGALLTFLWVLGEKL